MTTRIDCDTCVVRGLHCHDCVVTVLLGPPPELTIDDDEMAALDALATGGLVPWKWVTRPARKPRRVVDHTPASPVVDEPGNHTSPWGESPVRRTARAVRGAGVGQSCRTRQLTW